MTWVTVGTVTVLSRLLKNIDILKSCTGFVEHERLQVKLGTSFTDTRMPVERDECNIKIPQQMGTGIKVIFLLFFFVLCFFSSSFCFFFFF